MLHKLFLQSQLKKVFFHSFLPCVLPTSCRYKLGVFNSVWTPNVFFPGPSSVLFPRVSLCWWLTWGCHKWGSWPLMSSCEPSLSRRGALLGDGSKEDGYLYVSTEDVRVSLTIQRLQKSSPPIGGTFRIHLANTVISGKRRCKSSSWVSFGGSQVKKRQ